MGITLIEGKERQKILESGRARWISRDLRTSGHFLLLIRSKQVLRCSCIEYATPDQREHIIRFADRMLEDLGIKI